MLLLPPGGRIEVLHECPVAMVYNTSTAVYSRLPVDNSERRNVYGTIRAGVHRRVRRPTGSSPAHPIDAHLCHNFATPLESVRPQLLLCCFYAASSRRLLWCVPGKEDAP